MGRNFVTAERDQLFLLPPDARQWLPPGHLAWAVLEQAGEMDLAPFMAWYRADGQGRPAYHPRLMVTLVMYCYCKGIRSSRAIEMATFDDVGARVICGNLHPDHATVHRFVTRHEQPVKGLLVQSLVACARQGLVSVDVVAGDGTKVKASASMAANATAGQLEIEIAELEALLAAEVDAWLAQARAADAAGQALSGDGGDEPDAGGGPGTLTRLTDKIVRRQKARARLTAEEQARQQQARAEREAKITAARARAARAEQRVAREEAAAQAKVDDFSRRAAAKAAAGSRKGPDGRVPVAASHSAHVRQARQAAEQARQRLAKAVAAPAAAPAPDPPPKANVTDPASRVMPAKKGGFDQMYNLQVIAARHQVITAIATHDNSTDTGALHPMLELAAANLAAAGIAERPGKALFDAGYASEDNFTTPCQAELYVAVTRESRQTGRLRDGKTAPARKPGWQAMTARLDTPDGKAIYKQRAGMIEPVFAQLFNRLGRHLHYRDAKVDLELHLWAATHNLLKAIRARARRTAGDPARQPALAS
ncbi:MAG TPA: transposase [Streptosporangiaceae bacterium]|nr:transposase [Streptosporangiaceae bacterium]